MLSDVGSSTIRALRENLPQDESCYPASGWKTAIIVNTTKTAQGSRWEELGAILTHLFKFLLDSNKNISLVRLTEASETADKIGGLREAIQYIWNHQPSDGVLGAAQFKRTFLSASSQLYGVNTPHTSLIFMVPDGIMDGDLAQIQRAILQKCKLIRGSNLRASSLIISFVLIEPNWFMLEPLFMLATSVNEDCAVIGTAVCQCSPLN
jgi:hypothetical protein